MPPAQSADAAAKAAADEKAKADAAKENPKTKLVTVRVGKQPINEDGSRYVEGDTFDTTPERAEALAGFVTPLEAD